MCRFFVVFLAVLFLSTAVHSRTAVQTSWYLGPGVEGPITDWGESFWSSESLAHSVHGQVSLLAKGVDYDGWTKHILDFDSRIDGHANIMPADINGDGYLDLVSILAGNPGYVVLYEYTTSGYVKNEIVKFDNNLGTTWPYDMDGDGDIDLVASGEGGLIWVENDAGSFIDHVIDLSMGYLYAVPGDVENDGDIDIVVHDKTWSVMHGDLWLFRNNGAMTFIPEKIFTITKTDMWRVNLGDLNGDGFLDIQTSGEPIRVFLNDGSGVFWPKYTFNDTAHVDGSWLNDFDADGDMDIMGAHWGFAPYSPRPLFWLENDGSGTWFTYRRIGGDNGTYGDGGMATDVNLDGMMDALGSYLSVAWFEQMPGDSFAERPLPGNNVGGSHWIYGENLDGGPCIGDVDIDIIIANYGQFIWWENSMVSFFEAGELISSIFDAEDRAQWTTFGWDDCEPRGCENTHFVRSGETVAGIKSSPWIGPIMSSDDSLKDYGVSDGRYFQYMLVEKNLTAPDDISPCIYKVWVNYEGPFCEPVEPWLVRTQGYWRRQCKDDAHEDICAYVDSIHVYAGLFDGFDCDSACNLMNVSPPERDMCRKARRQFMALLLNIASGKLALCNCLEDGSEVGDIVAEIDSLLSGPTDHGTCVYAKTLADNINNGIGLVPCDTLFRPALARSVPPIIHPTTPNPFVNATAICYELSASQPVQLKIYDKMGRLVSVLVDRVQEPGFYQVEWKGLDDRGHRISSGIYFSRLKAGDVTIASKLILVR